jgi:hypothetical protein
MQCHFQPDFPNGTKEVQMTQIAQGRFWSVLDRIFPATASHPIAFDQPALAFDEDEEDGDDKLRALRDENFYWGWCLYGHW